MEYRSADPASRYREFDDRVHQDIDYLRRNIRKASRFSSVARAMTLALVFLASILPLITQLRELAAIPPWTATLAIVAAGGLIMFDRSSMWTENFTRWNARLMKTIEFKDNFDSKYARLVRLIGEAPAPADEDKLLVHLEDAFRALGSIRQEEAQQWATQYRAVLTNLSAEIKGKGGQSNSQEAPRA